MVLLQICMVIVWAPEYLAAFIPICRLQKCMWHCTEAGRQCMHGHLCDSYSECIVQALYLSDEKTEKNINKRILWDISCGLSLCF